MLVFIFKFNASERENIPQLERKRSLYGRQDGRAKAANLILYCSNFNAQKEFLNNYVFYKKRYFVKKKLAQESLNTFENAVDGSYGNSTYDVVLRQKMEIQKLCFPTWIGDAYCKENFLKMIIKLQKNCRN